VLKPTDHRGPARTPQLGIKLRGVVLLDDNRLGVNQRLVHLDLPAQVRALASTSSPSARATPAVVGQALSAPTAFPVRGPIRTNAVNCRSSPESAYRCAA